MQSRGVGYVLGVRRDHRIATHAGTFRAIDLAVTLPASVWKTHSCGPGSKGHRYYAWALVAIDDDTISGHPRAAHPA